MRKVETYISELTLNEFTPFQIKREPEEFVINKKVEHGVEHSLLPLSVKYESDLEERLNSDYQSGSLSSCNSFDDYPEISVSSDENETIDLNYESFEKIFNKLGKKEEACDEEGYSIDTMIEDEIDPKEEIGYLPKAISRSYKPKKNKPEEETKHQKYCKMYYQLYKERWKTYDSTKKKRTYNKSNKARIDEYSRNYYQKHKEFMKIKNALYYRKRIEKDCNTNRIYTAYLQDHKERSDKRESLKNNNDKEITRNRKAYERGYYAKNKARIQYNARKRLKVRAERQIEYRNFKTEEEVTQMIKHHREKDKEMRQKVFLDLKEERKKNRK